MSIQESLQSKFSDDGLVFSQFRDNQRVTIPAAKTSVILSYLKF